jgi:hypothetical protein
MSAFGAALRRLLAPPSIEDPGLSERAQTLHTILLAGAATASGAMVAMGGMVSPAGFVFPPAVLIAGLISRTS